MWESSELNSLQELESDGFELKIVSLYGRSSYHRFSSRQWTSIVPNGSHNIIQVGGIRVVPSPILEPTSSSLNSFILSIGRCFV